MSFFRFFGFQGIKQYDIIPYLYHIEENVYEKIADFGSD